MILMTAKIHVLHPQAAPLSGFLRVGHTGHRKLEALHAAGRFPYRRVVFDAAHITQRFRQLDDLSSVPETRRVEHFLLRHVDPAVRSARLGARLRIADEKVAKAMNDVKLRLVCLRDALADLQAKEGTPSRSRSPVFRGGVHSISAVLGR
jgi:hypothetical protein